MKYREIDYSIFKQPDGRWTWKLHPKIKEGGMHEIVSGEANSEADALGKIRAAIDKMIGGS